MTEPDAELERRYRVLDYASHRLAEMNQVLGRLQGVAGTFIGFSIAALAAIVALGIADLVLLGAFGFSILCLLVSSVIMIRESMTKTSQTTRLGTTAWFYRGNISIEGNEDVTTQFNQSLIEYNQVFARSDADWKNDCTSQILQLFVTQMARMKQIKSMNKAFRYGLYLSSAGLILGLAARVILFFSC